ncbi:serine/threonine-protein kinase [Mycobacterium camsae]|uniref:serine/threonine-protein kinase n=1 Tax=Mycobacterium gordonae TaxID=1778 RepID=UPI003D663B57
MGEVWRAFDTDTQRVVAIKVLPTHLADDPQFAQRFRREAFAAAGLANPHVVPIHHYGEINNRLYVDMRLIEGRDLHQIVAEGPLNLNRATSIVEQIASALHAAHKIGLVHRDVKPSNILIDDEDFAYLIDFGIARAVGQTSLTGTSGVIGTWAYMAPERFSRDQNDSRADVYALACVLHECLTGKQPFPASSVERQIAAHVSEPPPRPSMLQPTVPASMDAVVARGMAKDPDERFQTAKDLANAARAAASTYSGSAPTQAAKPPVTPKKQPRRQSSLRATAAAAANSKAAKAGAADGAPEGMQRPSGSPKQPAAATVAKPPAAAPVGKRPAIAPVGKRPASARVAKRQLVNAQPEHKPGVVTIIGVVFVLVLIVVALVVGLALIGGVL